MQAIEFESIVKDHAIPIPASIDLASDVRVKVVVLFDSAPLVASSPHPDAEIGDYFGCFPDFPEREPQGQYEQRSELE